MSDLSFSVQVEQYLEQLVESMEEIAALDDVDIDLIDGVLTVGFEDGAQIIINRQESAQQIWLVSPLGPAHFDYDSNQDKWLDDRTREPFLTVLGEAFSQKLGEPVNVNVT